MLLVLLLCKVCHSVRGNPVTGKSEVLVLCYLLVKLLCYFVSYVYEKTLLLKSMNRCVTCANCVCEDTLRLENTCFVIVQAMCASRGHPASGKYAFCYLFCYCASVHGHPANGK